MNEPPPQPLSPFMTVPQFVSYTGISRAAVYRLIALGLPSSNQVGIGRRVYVSEAVAWIKKYGPTQARKKLPKPPQELPKIPNDTM